MNKQSLSELSRAISSFPLDSTVLFRGRPVGTVIGYRRCTLFGKMQVIYKNYRHINLGKEHSFIIGARSFTSK